MPQRVINQIVEKRARSKDYVKKRIVKIVDARDPDVYFGVTIEPWPPRQQRVTSQQPKVYLLLGSGTLILTHQVQL